MSGIERSRIVGMSDKDLLEFTCGICQDIFKDPVMTQCCRQTYCKLCIEKWVEIQNNCPNDRRRLSSHELIPAPRLIINLLFNMNVKCDYFMDGCEVVTTIEALPQHLLSCDKRPKNNCETCGSKVWQIKGMATNHNCLNNLVIKMKGMADEINTLKRDNQQLNRLLDRESWVINSARVAINDFVIEEESDKFDIIKQKFFFKICQDAIFNNNTFAKIAEGLYSKLNDPVKGANPLPWHAFVFADKCGESMVKSQHYIRIRFNQLIIELFNAKLSR